jgi:release factor glutamine methyltransferase
MGPIAESQLTLRRALREAIAQLTAAQVPSASATAEVLLMHVLGRDRAFLYAHPEAPLAVAQERAYRHLLDQRAAGTPTQYLTGRQEFWGLSLHVEPGVFIPRPETEHVVEVSLAIVRERLQKPDARIVDVGTGSGAIALALAGELPQAEIVATDVSPQALRVARANAEALGLAGRVQFVHSILLDEFLSHHGTPEAGFDTRSFDLVVSNPPYVDYNQAAQLPREVREHEPEVALFSPEEGIAVTRRLMEQARVALAPNGWLVLELGYNMAGRVRALLGDSWVNVEVTNDLRGIPRVLAAQRL